MLILIQTIIQIHIYIYILFCFVLSLSSLWDFLDSSTISLRCKRGYYNFHASFYFDCYRIVSNVLVSTRLFRDAWDALDSFLIWGVSHGCMWGRIMNQRPRGWRYMRLIQSLAELLTWAARKLFPVETGLWRRSAPGSEFWIAGQRKFRLCRWLCPRVWWKLRPGTELSPSGSYARLDAIRLFPRRTRPFDGGCTALAATGQNRDILSVSQPRRLLLPSGSRFRRQKSPCNDPLSTNQYINIKHKYRYLIEK